MTTTSTQNENKIDIGILTYWDSRNNFHAFQMFNQTVAEAMDIVQNGYDKPVRFCEVKPWNSAAVSL